MPSKKFNFGDIERLTQKQADFVKHYLSNGGNLVEAMLSAGYKYKNRATASSMGARMVKQPIIARAIQRRLDQRNERMQLEEDYELKKAMDILEKCMTNKKVTDFRGNPVKDKDGNPVYAFDSKGANQALTTICRLRGKFRDKLDVTQDVGDRANRLTEIIASLNKADKENKS